MKRIKHSYVLLLLMISAAASFAQKGSADSLPPSGYLDFNGYYDTRQFSVLTLNLLANINVRTQYFSLTNYQGGSASSDLSALYSEQNVRWAPVKNKAFDLTLQYVIRSGNSNDDVKLGFRWKPSQSKLLQPFFKKINMTYSINPMLLQVQEHRRSQYMTMIEHVYFIKGPGKWKERIYLNGFADQNIVYMGNGQLMFKWVTEHQIGINISKGLYAVAEFRINNYTAQQVGFGYGLQYKIVF